MKTKHCKEKLEIDITHLPSRRSSSLTISYLFHHLSYWICIVKKKLFK